MSTFVCVCAYSDAPIVHYYWAFFYSIGDGKPIRSDTDASNFVHSFMYDHKIVCTCRQRKSINTICALHLLDAHFMVHKFKLKQLHAQPQQNDNAQVMSLVSMRYYRVAARVNDEV